MGSGILLVFYKSFDSDFIVLLKEYWIEVIGMSMRGGQITIPNGKEFKLSPEELAHLYLETGQSIGGIILILD